ncbi:DUF2634 domain-containing protein [Metabacillus litoralis]|uniref:DUF2634 domain-containing protein n=1 Tax=Metabacillus litoralis TaxID=152268 RepID=UPI00204229BA|nr:DUF2634 domain-containing protein [Metabacillus litoralis]MCM3411456.1 DUF2634 domain-containing protein [Metabacillus litoralis]
MLPVEAQTITVEILNDDLPTQGKSFLFDFNTGDFVTKDGKLVEIEGEESLKQWITMTIKTQINLYEIYEGVDHGVNMMDLIGSNYPLDFIQKEVQNEITSALLTNPVITSLSGWQFEKEGSILKVIFTVISTYDPIQIEEVLA